MTRSRTGTIVSPPDRYTVTPPSLIKNRKKISYSATTAVNVSLTDFRKEIWNDLVILINILWSSLFPVSLTFSVVFCAIDSVCSFMPSY